MEILGDPLLGRSMPAAEAWRIGLVNEVAERTGVGARVFASEDAIEGPGPSWKSGPRASWVAE